MGYRYCCMLAFVAESVIKVEVTTFCSFITLAYNNYINAIILLISTNNQVHNIKSFGFIYSGIVYTAKTISVTKKK